ncbi:hypothetical protein TNCV_4599751 [Trichonephila clavipes]|nr:hypothetical protein TNCV_4599751 [Trichonephila clavipes]
MIAGAYSQKDGRKRETMTEDKYKYRKHPQKAGRDDVPQSTSVLTKQSDGGGREEDGTAEGSKSIRMFHKECIGWHRRPDTVCENGDVGTHFEVSWGNGSDESRFQNKILTVRVSISSCMYLKALDTGKTSD